jgi:hypothetical protein
LSKVAVASRVVSWLETPSPTFTSDGIANVSLPTSVQFAPSADMNAEIVAPRRSSFTQAGAVPTPPLVLVDRPALATRRWNASPLPAETSMRACAESAVSRSRIHHARFHPGLTFSTEATRAMMSPSPLRGCHAKCSASALPQTSAPPPETVERPGRRAGAPAGPTAPMSCDCQGAGSVGAGAGEETETATLADVVAAPASSIARAVSV